MPISDRPSDRSDGGGRVLKWFFLSGFAHVILIAVLLIMPFLPSKAPNYPVYTLDLVGGENLGGGAGTAVEPAPKAKPVPEVKAAPEVKETKRETKKEPKEKPLTRTQLAKENAKKAADSRAEMTERLAAKAKKEAEEKRQAEEAEAEKTRERLQQLREKRIEEALAEIKSRAEADQKKQQVQQPQQQKGAPATSNVVGDKPGAAAPGVGGTGGGVVKGPEFLRYTNIIQDRVKTSWTWVGRRTDLKVTVNVSIQENGEITGIRLVGTSGDRSFDDSVIRAVRKANPLPPPPEDYRAHVLNVVLPFNSKDLGS